MTKFPLRITRHLAWLAIAIAGMAAGLSHAQTVTPMVCSVTATPATIAPGESSAISATCTGNPTTYTWEVSGGPPVSGPGGVVVLFQPGVYSYRVRASNGTQTSELSNAATVTVRSTLSLPQCTVIASATKILVGETSTLNAQCSNQATSVAWFVTGDGPGISGPGMRLTFPQAGVYTYRVQGFNLTGAGGLSDPVTITVSAPTPGAVKLPDELIGNYSGSGSVYFSGNPVVNQAITANVNVRGDGTVSGVLSNGCQFFGLSNSSAFTIDTPSDAPASIKAGAWTITRISDCWDTRMNNPTPTTSTLLQAAGTSSNMTFTLLSSNASGALEVQLNSLTKPVSDTLDVEGMWWNPAESGWGVGLVIGAAPKRIPFATLYIYAGSSPAWMVMSSGTWVTPSEFVGDLHVTSGTDYRAQEFSSASSSKVGSLRMQFTSASTALLSYDVKQADGSVVYIRKAVQRLDF